jgi:hypothetical protein
VGFPNIVLRFVCKGILLMYITNLKIIMGRAYSTPTKNDWETVDTGTYLIDNSLHFLVNRLVVRYRVHHWLLVISLLYDGFILEIV